MTAWTSTREMALARIGAFVFMGLGLAGGLALAIVLLLRGGEATAAYSSATIDATCLSSPGATTHSGAVLDAFTPTRSGVTYETSSSSLKLLKQAGTFTQTTLGIASADVKVGCAADFDEDGWADFVATSDDASSYVRFYKNRTFDNPAPDWTVPTNIRTPKFVAGPNIVAATTPSRSDIGCGDFNGDGHQDFFLVRCTSDNCDTDGIPSITTMFLGKGDGTFQAGYSFLTTPASLKLINWWGTSAYAALDYNGDGKLDMVWALANPSGSDATVVALLSDGAAQPKFNTRVTLLPTSGSLGFANKVPGIAIGDITGDGNKDLVIGSPDTTILRFYPGQSGGGFGAAQSMATGFAGSANSIFLADFSGDGKLDVVVATDGNYGHPGGKVYYWPNNGTSTPFSGGVTYSSQTSAVDFDMGWSFDYDHDPDHTNDFVAADGNDSAKYFLFANRTTSLYVTCGTVASGILDIGALANTEMTVTAVRIAPTGSPASGTNGTMTWEASINGGTTWVPAPACPDNSAQFCAPFTTTVGQQIRWRATMCSNSAHTLTPSITAVATSFTYVQAANYFRSGPIARDGVIYVGAYRQPGSSGHFFALSDATGATLWDAATILDTAAVTSRNLFLPGATQNPTLCENPTHLAQCRLDFKATTVSDPTYGPPLLTALLAGSSAAATSLINWWTSKRFGLTTFHVFGGVVGSTPALLTHPVKPSWFTLATSADQATITTYDALYAARPQLVFVGAQDGALHAFFTDPADASDPLDGTEAWAYLPADVGSRLLSDQTTGAISAYSDGSPTLVNAKVLGQWRTLVVSGEGNGGRAVYALDVTDTVTVNSTSHTLSTAGKGPIPLWTYTDANMGKTLSKPTVIRTKIAGVERWLAVFASGALSGSDVGDSVYAIDLDTGLLVWRFDLGDSNTYISSDITAVETDDEAGTVIDGYIDRLYFADNKGRLWKLDPAAFSGTTMTSVNSLINVGLTPKALFSTRLTAGALGADRAIAGTIAAATDSTGKLVLYFGTGGTDDTASNVQNAFYGVYADTGAIRSKLDGTTGIAVGTKFYGGVLEQDGQIIFTDGSDPSGLGLCAATAGQIVAIDASTFAQQFTTAAAAKIVAPVYAVNGEIYSVTTNGNVVTSAYTGVVTASGGVSGSSSNSGSGAIGATSAPFSVLGWHQLY